MKYRGFTLVEILIVLAVIGVIASLTMPTLNNNVLHRRAGATVMRTLSMLNNSNELLLTRNRSASLAPSCLNPGAGKPAEAYFKEECLGRFAKGSLGSVTLKFNGGTLALDNQSAFFTPDGSIITYLPLAEPSWTKVNGMEPTSLILLDVNGTAGPSLLGRDQFVFDVFRNGDVEAVGSRNWVRRRGIEETLVEKCSAGKNIKSADIGTTIFCAGSIVDNGGNVKYSW